MQCKKCNKEIPDYSQFCPICGEKQEVQSNDTGEVFPLLLMVRYIKRHLKWAVAMLFAVVIVIVAVIVYQKQSEEQREKKEQASAISHLQSIVGKYVSDVGGGMTLRLNPDKTATFDYDGDKEYGYWEEKIGIIEINFSKSFQLGYGGDYYSTFYFYDNVLWLSMSAMRSLEYNKSFKMEKIR